MTGSSTPPRGWLQLHEAAWLLQRNVKSTRRLVAAEDDAARTRLIRCDGSYRIHVTAESVQRRLVSRLASYRLEQLRRGEIAAPRPASPTTAPRPLTDTAPAARF